MALYFWCHLKIFLYFIDLEHEAALGGSLSGNQLMITGSKHLHCPPPEGFNPGKLLAITTSIRPFSYRCTYPFFSCPVFFIISFYSSILTIHAFIALQKQKRFKCEQGQTVPVVKDYPLEDIMPQVIHNFILSFTK